MASPSQSAAALPAEPPKIELTINTKPAPKKDEPENTAPQLNRTDSDTIDSPLLSEAEEVYTHRPARPTRRVPPPRRAYTPSPVRVYNGPRPIVGSSMLTSSTQLLDNVPKYDGIIDMPFPARSSVYMTTFPFTNRDVKKWSWLFAHGVENEFLTEHRARRGDDDSDSGADVYRNGYVPRSRRRDRSLDFIPGAVDIPSVYLGCALDPSVVPDALSKEQGVRYFIVVQNRNRPERAKLLVAESRKAAGIMMYYEALSGHSISFVGAVVGPVAKKMRKFKKVDGVAEAKAAAGEGVVGVIC